MPFQYKLTDDKKAVSINEAGFPVVINDDGEEIGLDAIHLYNQRPVLENQVKQFKELTEKQKNILQHFKDVDEKDLPEYAKKARAAIETVSNLSSGDLVKAKDVEAIKKQAQENMLSKIEETEKVYKEQIADLELKRQTDNEVIYDLLVKDKFVSSEFVKEKLNMSVLGAQRYFKNNFEVEETTDEKGKVKKIVVGYFDDGTKIYSKARAGELAEFEEALSLLVEKSVEKNTLLKGKNQSGSNSGNSNFQSNNSGSGPKTSVDLIANGLKDLGF